MTGIVAKRFGVRKTPPKPVVNTQRSVARGLDGLDRPLEPGVAGSLSEHDAPLEPERRKGNRVRRLLAGKIIYSSGELIADCILRNVSQTGARIEMAGNVPLPEYFEVVRLKERTIAEARMIWRRGNEVGVTWMSDFVSLLDSHAPEHHRLARRLGLTANQSGSSLFSLTALD
jgi:hypothetical protein